MKLWLPILLVVSLEPARQVWLLDDFESAEHVAAHELSWIVLGDELLGGTSSLALETVSSEESGHALRLEGSVGEGPTAFTGAWAPLDGGSRPVDLRAFDALRFLARGEGTFQAGLRSGPATTMTNFMASFTPGPDWKAFEIPFESLSAAGPGSANATFRPEEVHWLGITTAPGADGPFHLELDDVDWFRTGVRSRPRLSRRLDRRGPSGSLSRRRRRASPGASSLGIRPATARSRSLPDAVSVAVMADDGGERVWFRIGLQARRRSPGSD